MTHLNDLRTFYIGYLEDARYLGASCSHSTLLCVSDNRDAVIFYLKKVRCLHKSEYSIMEAYLDDESAMSMYENYMLYPYSESLKFLTERDIDAINSEVDAAMEKINQTYFDLIDFEKLLNFAPNEAKKMKLNISSLISELKDKLTKEKNLRTIAVAVINSSDVLSPDIKTYLAHMGFMKEDRELINRFYYRVEDDD